MKVKRVIPWDPAAVPSFWVNHASRLLMRLFEQRLRPLGLGMAYLPVVFALEEGGALVQRELAERARVEQPTMAALLARMERDGLVARGPHPSDKRASLLSLTPSAKALIPEVKEQLLQVAERLTEGFTEQERASFMALLQRAVHNLQKLVDG